MVEEVEGKAALPLRKAHLVKRQQNGKLVDLMPDGQPQQFPDQPLPEKCPQCGSSLLYRDGMRYTDLGEIQRWLCRGCGYRFSVPHKSYKECQTIGKHQVCAILKDAKNLNNATIEKVAGVIPQDAKGSLVKYAAHLERQGYYGDTSYMDLMRALVKDGANLYDSEDVKTKIARHKWKGHEWKDSVKMLAVYAYDQFCKMENITWTKPRYKQQETILYVPDEKDLDALTSSTQSKRMAAYLQCLKETFADPGEILRLEWRDIKDNIITINHPVKGHLPGQVEVTNRLLSMLNALPKTSKLVFPTSYAVIRQCFQEFRKRAAVKLQNPKLLEISFKSYRHWGGSMLAHYTNGNVLTIKKMLRHKSVQNTMKYIHTLEFKDEDFEIATATTEEEIKQLGQAGFIKYDEMKGIHFYRKPKRFSGLK
jgi:integrase